MSKIENGKMPLSIFFNLSKAFDTLDHTVRLNKLHLYEIRGVYLKWFSSYLRIQHVFTQICFICNDKCVYGKAYYVL